MASDGRLRLDIDTDHTSDVATIRLAGELDISTAPRLIGAVCDLATNGTRRIELDCGDVEFVDSAGIRALIVGRNESAQRGTSLELVSSSKPMRRVLDMTGLSSLLVAPAAH